MLDVVVSAAFGDAFYALRCGGEQFFRLLDACGDDVGDKGRQKVLPVQDVKISLADAQFVCRVVRSPVLFGGAEHAFPQAQEGGKEGAFCFHFGCKHFDEPRGEGADDALLCAVRREKFSQDDVEQRIKSLFRLPHRDGLTEGKSVEQEGRSALYVHPAVGVAFTCRAVTVPLSGVEQDRRVGGRLFPAVLRFKEGGRLDEQQ